MQTNPSLLEETGDEELTQFVEMLKTPYTSVQFQGLLNVRSFLSSDENRK